MASLHDYVAQQFPQHDIDVWPPGTPADLELTDNTAVSFVDLPVRRVVAYIAVGVIVLGAIGAVLSLLIADSGVAAVIGGVFGAAIGAFMGAIIGGARFAGERATSQPRAPGETITVVAAFLDDPQSAISPATLVGPAADYEVRIVDNAGGWRSPATGSTAA